MNKFTFLQLSLLFLVTSCVKNTETHIDTDKIITLQVNDQENTIEVPADGTTKLKVTAALGEFADDGKTILFNTSNGELSSYDGAAPSNNISQVAVNKEASVLLKTSLNPEKDAYVTAKVDNYYVKRYINFVTANPDTFFVKPDAYFTTADKINIDVDLLSNGGLVSSKVPVYFEALVTGTTNIVVTIDSYKYTDNTSKVNPTTVRAVLQKVNPNTGDISVKVKCLNKNQQLIEKVVNLKFQ